MRSDDPFRIQLLPVVTLVLWLASLGVGLAGQAIGARKPPSAAELLKPTEATMVNVSLDPAPAVPAVAQPTEASPAATPPLPAMPQPIAISPAPDFAVPMTRLEGASPTARPVFQQIVYGRDEGNQPKPQYPIEAQLDGEEGTVVVRFVVAADGRIASAEITRACAWPLLNQAAARSIRETWSFPLGTVRYYQVSITYQRKR